MYTRKDFGKSLKQWVLEKQDVALIGHWSYSVYLEYIDVLDLDFVDVLLTLNHMEDGPEFELSYKRLDEIADDLIAGRKPDL